MDIILFYLLNDIVNYLNDLKNRCILDIIYFVLSVDKKLIIKGTNIIPIIVVKKINNIFFIPNNIINIPDMQPIIAPIVEIFILFNIII